MKKYWKEALILAIQICVLYGFPKAWHLTNPIGVFVNMLICTLLLSIILGACSNNNLRFCFPFAVTILFVPTIDIYFNSSANVFVGLFLFLSSIGVGTGYLLQMFWRKYRNR